MFQYTKPMTMLPWMNFHMARAFYRWTKGYSVHFFDEAIFA